MIRYIARRILYVIPIVLGVMLFTFLLFFVVRSPHSIARQNLGKNPTSRQIQDWLREHNYNKPRWTLFWEHAFNLVRFQFGKSDVTGESIADRLRSGAGPSLRLMGPMLAGELLIAISCALYIAYFRGTYIDVAATFLAVLLMSIIILLYIVTGQLVLGRLLRWFPIAGYLPGPDGWRFIIMPMLVGIIAGLGAQIRFYRTVMLDEINQDYVRSARAKGCSEGRILFRHILKNAASPIITSTVLAIPFLILGSVLLENFFGIPGLGSMSVDAIHGGDFAIIRAVVFLGSLLYILGAVMTDVCYVLVNPRVRLE